MTTDQAVAILEAERVLETVGCGGPDVHVGSAWEAYVKEAGRTIRPDPSYRAEFSDLAMLQECPCDENCDGAGDCSGDCSGMCKCRN